jgi:DNA-directed RNA polymerase subunit RPC12/RpoP
MADESSSQSPACQRCAGASEYVGRISMPPQMIYRCKSCGHQMWVQNNFSIRAPQAHQPQAQQQQQQQPQPKPDPE